MSAEPTIAARHAQVILDAAAYAGVDVVQLLDLCGVSAVQLAGPEARIPLSSQTKLWHHAVRLTGDEALAVRVGAAVAPGRYGVLEPVILSSRTVGDALNRYMRLERLSLDGAVTTLRLRGSVAVVSHGPLVDGDLCSPYGVEVTFAGLLSLARAATQLPIVPRAVKLKRTAPPDASEHTRVFGVAPQFDADENALLLDPAVLDFPMRSADPPLAEVLERYALQQVAKLPPRTDTAVAPRLRAWLSHAVASGPPSMRTAARELAVSERTLQRRLQAEATSFAATVDEVRKELAMRHAEDHAMPIEVVALLTGFSEKSAFYRAFRRWTGLTPAAYRVSRVSA